MTRRRNLPRLSGLELRCANADLEQIRTNVSARAGHAGCIVAFGMSSADGNGLRSRGDSAAIVLKLLQAATTWLRCRNLLVAKRTDDARAELSLLHAALNELDGQFLSEEHSNELKVLHQEAVRLDAKLRQRDSNGVEDN